MDRNPRTARGSGGR